MQDRQNQQTGRIFWQSRKGTAVLFALLVLFAALSFRFGSAELSFADFCRGIAGAPGYETQSAILRYIRLPRVLGAVLAVLTSASPWADRLLSPAVRVVRAAPVASFILLVLLWTGRNRVPAVIAAMMVTPVVWDNLSRGIQAMDPKLLELARCCRFSRWNTAVLIYLPSLRPYALAALTTATGLAWKSGVAAEVLCLPEPSLGQRIYYTKYYLDIPELFAWTAATVTLSMALERLLRTGLARWGRGWDG